MVKSTIPKKQILSSFIAECKKLNYYECVYEWFSNMGYSNSRKSFVDIITESFSLFIICKEV